MSSLTSAQVTFFEVLAFLGGGLAGSFWMFVSILNELDRGPKVRWRAKFLVWRWWGRLFGDRSFDDVADRADRARRAVYGIVLLGTMSDLGGPRPIPSSREATDALLAEAERRYQVEHAEFSQWGRWTGSSTASRPRLK
jgi:hypothetical protein